MAYLTIGSIDAIVEANRPDLVEAVKKLEDSHLEFASNHLNSLNWVGTRVSSTQSDAWPRSYVPIDRFDISLGYRDTSVLPEEIKLIVIELAIRFLTNPGITSDSASGIAVTGVTLPDSNYDLEGDYIRASIRPFLKQSGNGLIRIN